MKDKTNFYYKKLGLTDDYQYESEEEDKEQQASKRLDKKKPPKKQTKDELRKFNEWVNKKETGINSEIFQKYFSLEKSSNMLKDVYKTNYKNKNNKLVNVIKSGLSDLKDKTENMGEEEKN